MHLAVPVLKVNRVPRGDQAGERGAVVEVQLRARLVDGVLCEAQSLHHVACSQGAATRRRRLSRDTPSAGEAAGARLTLDHPDTPPQRPSRLMFEAH